MTQGTKHTHPRLGALTLAIALTLGAGSAHAGQLGSIDVVTPPDGRMLPVYAKDGRGYVVGTPGQEYGIRVCNTTGDRVLAVMSVDGVNVVSGETASPAQSGYVLDALRVRRHQRLAQESRVARRRSISPSWPTPTRRAPDVPRTSASSASRSSASGRIARLEGSPAKIAAAPATEPAAPDSVPPARWRRTRRATRRRARRDGGRDGRTGADRRRSARATADRSSRTWRPRASCARARRRTRRSRSITIAARISSRWAFCRRPPIARSAIRFPRERGSCRNRPLVERSVAGARRLRGARAARILAGDARARHRRRAARRGPDARLRRGQCRGVRRALCAPQGRSVSLPLAPLRSCRRRRRTLPGRVDERDPCRARRTWQAPSSPPGSIALRTIE